MIIIFQEAVALTEISLGWRPYFVLVTVGKKQRYDMLAETPDRLLVHIL